MLSNISMRHLLKRVYSILSQSNYVIKCCYSCVFK
nr:MAG TPA: hypothetical protein [Caudoviricetes sp.]